MACGIACLLGLFRIRVSLAHCAGKANGKAGATGHKGHVLQGLALGDKIVFVRGIEHGVAEAGLFKLGNAIPDGLRALFHHFEADKAALAL